MARARSVFGEDIYERSAKLLGWTEADTHMISLMGLRALIYPHDKQLADEITAVMRQDRHLYSDVNLDGAAPVEDKVWVEAEYVHGGSVVLTLVEVAERRRLAQVYGRHVASTTIEKLGNFPLQYEQKMRQGYPVRFKMNRTAFEDMLTLGRPGPRRDAGFEGAGDDTTGGTYAVSGEGNLRGHESDEEAPTQDDLNNSAVISENRWGYALTIDGKLIERFTMQQHEVPQDAAFQYAKRWMAKNKYWPNLYFVNERGNIELMDHQTGKFLKGWV